MLCCYNLQDSWAFIGSLIASGRDCLYQRLPIIHQVQSKLQLEGFKFFVSVIVLTISTNNRNLFVVKVFFAILGFVQAIKILETKPKSTSTQENQSPGAATTIYQAFMPTFHLGTCFAVNEVQFYAVQVDYFFNFIVILLVTLGIWAL